MLAAYCPQCGAPNPVSLAAPTTLHCSHCHFSGSPPPDVTAELQRAAQMVGAMDARRRQLSGVQRRALLSRSAGCIYLVLFLVLTLGFAGMGVSCSVQEETPPTWFLALGWVPVLIMILSGALGGAWIRKEQRRLEEACAAEPPRVPGEPARCHLCGAPLPTTAGQAIARCAFCQTDNVVSSRALAHARQQQSQVVTSFETAVRQRSNRVLTTSALAKFMLVGMAIVAPIATIVLTIVVGAILYQYEGPADETIEYAAWKTGDGLCLAQVRTSPDGTTILDFGVDPIRGVKPMQPVPSSAKLERLTAKDLVGRQAYGWGGAGKIKRVYTRLVDEKNNRIDIEVAGKIVETGQVSGVCLVQGEPPKQLAPLEENAADHLVVVGDRLFWVSYDTIRSVPTSGGKPKAIYESDNFPIGLATDGEHLYFEETSKLVRITPTGSDKKVLGKPDKAGMLDEIHALVVGVDNAYYATDKGVQRIPKGGGEPTSLSAVADGRGLILDQGALYFHSAAKGALYRVEKGAAEAETVAQGLKLTPELNLGVDEERVYFVTADAELYGWPKTGGKPTRVLELIGPVAAFVLHRQKAHWWVDGNFVGVGGGVFSSALDATEPAVNRLPTFNQVNTVAVDSERLFWIDGVTERVMSLAL